MRKSMLLAWCICFVTMPTLVFSQSRQVAGTVTDDKGEPLPAVSVLQKGTNNGTSTDEKGSFKITVTGGTPVLQFSYAGMQAQEVAVGASASYNITMASAGGLSEVVVTALGITRKEKSIGYSTQQIKGEDLTFTKDQNVVGLLAGKIAGVQVIGSSGASLGGTQKIKIRGVNSLNGNDQPLIVIDGTPIANSNFAGSNGPDYGNISQDINPDDIESVSVLKGPAASALYGLRGQFGVIMITTNHGKKNAPTRVRFNSALSVEKAGNFLPLQNIYGVGNNQTYLTLASGQKYINGNDESWGPKMDGTPVRMYYSFYPQDPQFGQLTPFVPQPNNIEDFFETGHTINNGVSVSGGSEKMTFKLSYNNGYIKGIMPNTSLKRNNLGVNTTFDITPKLTLGTNVNWGNNDATRPSQGYQGSFTGAVQWFQRNLDINRLRNYKYSDGTIMNWNVNPNTTTATIVNNRPIDWNNPYFDAYENTSNDQRNHLFGDVNLQYQVLPGLRLTGFIRTDMYTQDFTHKDAIGGRLDEGYSTSKYEYKEFNYEFLAQYTKEFNDISLNVNAGANKYDYDLSGTGGSTVGGLSSTGFYSLGATASRPNLFSFFEERGIKSAYGMASIGYKDIYFIDGSIRKDISSTLEEGNNSYWYPSASASMVFSELLRITPLSFGKLRLSYAKAGFNVAPYQTRQAFNQGTTYTVPNGTPINTLSFPDRLNNSNLRASFANSYEAGVDLEFFKGRLGVDFTYYNQQNKDQAIDLSVSGTSGATSAVVNAGLIENKGIEISILAKPIQTSFFKWSTTLNYARNQSMIKELAPGLDAYQLDNNTYSSVPMYLIAYANKPYGSLVGQAYLRDPKTGKIMLDASNLPMFETNHNFGSVLPKFTGGFINNFKIWKVELDAMIDFQSGGQFFSWSKMLAVKSGQAEETAALNDKGFNVRDPLASGGGVKVNGISSTTGQEVTAYVDARSYFRNTIGTKIYEEWLFDASYVKLREVSLGFRFTKNMLGKTPFNSAKISLIARNPWMIWQKAPKGLEPSELSSGANGISWLEKGEFQTVRSYGVNLNFSF